MFIYPQVILPTMIFGRKNRSNLENGLKGESLYNQVIGALEASNLRYDENRNGMFVKVQFKGDDLRIVTFIKADEKNTTLSFDCPLEFEIAEGNEGAVLQAVNEINNGINFGTFTIRENRVWYRYHMVPFGKLSNDDIGFLLQMVVRTVDEYDGKLASVTGFRTPVNDVMYG